jgi:ABC-2 type transport system ATP-binding protein
MIRIENIVKHYGDVRALDGLNLNVEPGVVYGFLGPNGAGKTTTMRILTGMAHADRGSAWILGNEVSGERININPSIGVLPEEPAFYPWMTAYEYLCKFVSPLYGLDPSTSESRTVELLNTLGLEKAGNRRIKGFSRGMRQRLGLAQALIHEPPILLLDEPVSALDPAGRKDILELIEQRRGETTVLLSTHILADVDRTCDVIGIINEGQLITQSRREELLTKYAIQAYEIEAEDVFGQWIDQARNLPYIEEIEIKNKTARVLVQDAIAARRSLLKLLVEEDVPVRRFESVQPTLEDVFLRLTRKESQR